MLDGKRTGGRVSEVGLSDSSLGTERAASDLAPLERIEDVGRRSARDGAEGGSGGRWNRQAFLAVCAKIHRVECVSL